MLRLFVFFTKVSKRAIFYSESQLTRGTLVTDLFLINLGLHFRGQGDTPLRLPVRGMPFLPKSEDQPMFEGMVSMLIIYSFVSPFPLALEIFCQSQASIKRFYINDFHDFSVVFHMDPCLPAFTMNHSLQVNSEIVSQTVNLFPTEGLKAVMRRCRLKSPGSPVEARRCCSSRGPVRSPSTRWSTRWL